MILPLNLRLTAHLFCRPQNQISKSQMKFVVNTRPLKKTHAPISLNRLSVSLFSLSKEIKTKSRNKEINKEIPPRSRLCIRWLVVLALAPAPCSCSLRFLSDLLLKPFSVPQPLRCPLRASVKHPSQIGTKRNDFVPKRNSPLFHHPLEI